jgi:RNA polymerase sigma-70 factor (ECF subfamily)
LGIDGNIQSGLFFEKGFRYRRSDRHPVFRHEGNRIRWATVWFDLQFSREIWQVGTSRLLPDHYRDRLRVATSDRFSQLIVRVAETGDRSSFAELFDHFAPRLKAYLVRLGSEPAQAEELTQEVMITLWRKAALFDPERATASTWLFRIARNRRIDVLRRDRSALLDAEDPSLRPAAPEDQDEELDARLREERIRKAMTTLPPEQMELIRSAFFSGLSHSQIAEETGLPLGTVKSRIRLAFARLRRVLEADEAVDTD